MNQSSFRPRVLLLATALAAAGAVGAQTMGSTPESTATPPPPASSTSYAPCTGLKGAALSDCLKTNDAGNADASKSASTPAASTDSNASATASTPTSSIDSNTPTIAANSGAASKQKPAATKPKPAGASTDSTQVASAKPSRAQSKAPTAKANPADTAYRSELRNCVQQTGDARESCLDQAIEKHERA